MELFLESLDSEVIPELDDESKHLHNVAFRSRLASPQHLQPLKFNTSPCNTRGSKA